jgi:hypothetical protein
MGADDTKSLEKHLLRTQGEGLELEEWMKEECGGKKPEVRVMSVPQPLLGERDEHVATDLPDLALKFYQLCRDT